MMIFLSCTYSTPGHYGQHGIMLGSSTDGLVLPTNYRLVEHLRLGDV